MPAMIAGFLIDRLLLSTYTKYMDNLVIRPAEAHDAQSIANIYNSFITGTTVTFEEEVVSVEEILHRMQKVQAIPLPWLCAEVDGALAGYAYAGHWRERSAYRFVAESTIYLSPSFTGLGIGKTLYRALIGELKSAGMHVVMGVIALPNPVSVALHEKLGFIKAAHFKEVGFKFNRWIDVGYWQLNL